jgi:hypothetical protein
VAELQFLRRDSAEPELSRRGSAEAAPAGAGLRLAEEMLVLAGQEEESERVPVGLRAARERAEALYSHDHGRD